MCTYTWFVQWWSWITETHGAPAFKWCFWDIRCRLLFREATRKLAGTQLSCIGTTIHARSVWLGYRFPSSARALWLLLHQLAWSWVTDLHVATDSIYSMYTELIMLLIQDKWRLWYLRGLEFESAATIVQQICFSDFRLCWASCWACVMITMSSTIWIYNTATGPRFSSFETARLPAFFN